MKKLKVSKLFISIFIILFFGCAPIPKRTINRIPQLNTINILDLTKYTNEGFTITPESLKGDYKPIGQIYCEIYPEVNRVFVSNGYVPTESERMRGITGESTNADLSPQYKWVTNEDFSTIENAIDEIYEAAIAMGGNTIMEFSVKKSMPFEFTVNESEVVTMERFEITGFIINNK